jgi:hypothetical protein
LIQQLRSYNHLGLKWLGLPWAEQALLLEATLLLLIARILISYVPFGRIAPFLGQRAATPPASFPIRQPGPARQIGLAVRTMSHYMPWQSTCLVQALAAQAMLRRRRLPGTLYLGVARTPEQQLEAHAWLQHGPVILTGAQGRARYTVITTFTTLCAL